MAKRASVPPLRKAYMMNQSQKYLGVFAEIGAGQEVSRTFFNARMASNTIAKSMCAYAKGISDDVYLEHLDDEYIKDPVGNGIPYTVRFRLLAMLNHEYNQLFGRMTKGNRVEETARSRGGVFPQLFVYANTITTGDASPGEKSEKFHGWMGVRIHCPETHDDPDETKGSYIDFFAHVILLEQDRRGQYTTIGMMGVNMIEAACSLLSAAPFRDKDDDEKLKELESAVVDSLFDEIGLWKIRVDVLEINPSAELKKTGWMPNNRRLAMLLVHNRLSHDTLMSAHRFKVSSQLGGVNDYEEKTLGRSEAEKNYHKRFSAIKKWLRAKHSATVDDWAYPVDDLQVPSRFLYGKALSVGVGEWDGSVKDLSIKVPADVVDRLKGCESDRFPLVLLPYTDFTNRKTYSTIEKQDFLQFGPIDNAYKKWKQAFSSSGVLLTRSTDMGWAIDMLKKSILKTPDASAFPHPFQLLLSKAQWLEVVSDDEYAKRRDEVKKRIKIFDAQSRERGLTPEERRPFREDMREAERELGQLSDGIIDCLQRIERNKFTIVVCATRDEVGESVRGLGDEVVHYVEYLLNGKKLVALSS